MTYRNYSLAQLQQADAAHHLHPFTDHRELRAAGSRMITRGRCVVYDLKATNCSTVWRDYGV
jgi:putrescine aminotransferase